MNPDLLTEIYNSCGTVLAIGIVIGLFLSIMILSLSEAR